MLTSDEIDFLNKIPTDRIVHIYPFNAKVKRIAEEIIASIKKLLPGLEVEHMGASALGISGQNDLDIYVFSDPKNFDKYLPDLIKLFGEPLHKHETFCEWKFKKENFDIELYLTSKNSETMQKQIKVFETLKGNEDLLKEYEGLKASMNGKTFKEYQEKKFEFYHKILDKNDMVRTGYNKIAKDYAETRIQFQNLKYLDKLNELLKPDSVVLDIGCGSGIPIDTYFIEKGHKVVGIDISSEQISLARKNVPEAEYQVKDMNDIKAGEFEVDAVVSFYTIFHIPREKHFELLKKINSFLPPGGLILITMGTSDWEGTEDFHGTKMFWSHFGAEKNKKLISEAGFEILFDEIDSSGGEKHQIILAEKI